MTPEHTSTDFDDIGPSQSTPVPAGFRAVQIGGPFIGCNGPLYAKWTGERLLLGFRVEDRLALFNRT
jgi:hypothetical protein